MTRLGSYNSWLFDVQAHPPTRAPAPGTVEDGQLLLMRPTSQAGQPPFPRLLSGQLIFQYGLGGQAVAGIGSRERRLGPGPTRRGTSAPRR
jgi:hypothetical protein